MKVAVDGAGAWGTTLASIISHRAETWLWAREDEVVDSIGHRGENEAFLRGFALPPDLRATGSLDTVLDGADVVVIAVPAQHVRDAIAEARPMLDTVLGDRGRGRRSVSGHASG